MYQRALVLALMAAGVVLPGTTQAANDCTQMFVYSVNQFCRTLSNGFSQCQPVGMVGPAPNCAKPGLPPVMPMPLAPPVLQTPYSYIAPFPAPGGVAPFVAVQPAPAAATPPVAPAAAPVAAAKPVAPMPIAAAPSVPVAAVPSASVTAPTSAPAPVVAVAPPAPEPAKVEAAPPVVPVAPATAPVTVAEPVATPVAPPAQVGAAAAPASAAAEPAMPPSITLQDLQDGLAHFGFNRAELSGQSRAELDAWLKQPLPKGRTLRVTGHADRLGPAAYNLKLSGRRAETVKKYLVGKGVAGQDIKVVAKGETEPVKACKGGATKATIACLAPNRRVEIDPQ